MKTTRSSRLLLFAAVLIMISPSILLAATVQLSWQPNSEPDLHSYNVYYGTQPRTYGPPVPADKDATHTLSGLDEGAVYYFAVTAVDNNGNESGFSKEISKTTPIPDIQPPVVAITSPSTSGSFTAAADSIDIAGTASSDQSIQQVTWYDSNENTGIASGTDNWVIQGLQLTAGTNTIFVTATDTSGNTSEDSIEILFDPYRLLWSINSDRSNATDVSNTTISGDGYIYLTPAASVAQVAFMIDGKFHNTDKVAPYDLGLPFRTATLANGDHVISTHVNLVGGGRVIFDTPIVVQNQPNPPADITPPTITITSPTSADSHTTEQAVIVISGTASDDLELAKIVWDSSSGASGTASGTGSWTITDLQLAEGQNVITVTATDSAGNQAEDKLTVIYNAPDIKAPVVTITAPMAPSGEIYQTGQASVQIAGKATDDRNINQVTWSLGNASGTALGTEDWSTPSIALSNGLNTITVTAVDDAGNQGSATIDVNYVMPDTTAPVVDITSPTAAGTFTTDSRQIRLGGTAGDDRDLRQVTWVNSTGKSGTATGTQNWSTAAIDLAEGVNTITVTATDGAGNQAEDRLTVTYKAPDTQAPVLTITAPALSSGGTYQTGQGKLQITGKATDDRGVRQVKWSLGSAGGTAAGTDDWSTPSIALNSGRNTIIITAVDDAGNKGSATIDVNYTPPDTTAPVVDITIPTAAGTFSTNSRQIRLGGTAGDDRDLRKVTWVNSAGGSGTATGTQNWSISAIELTEGVNAITVTATDAAGNQAEDRLTVTYKVPDTQAPVVTITAPPLPSGGTYRTNQGAVQITGKAVDDRGVRQVKWSLGSAGGMAAGTNDWSTPSIALSGGRNTITITAVDDAGNQGSATIDVNYAMPDTTAPVVDITSPTAAGTFTTNNRQIRLEGTAGDDRGLREVTWTNSAGSGGTATGTQNWSIPAIDLTAGINTITVTATDGAGNQSSTHLTVNYLAADTEGPAIKISSPTTRRFYFSRKKRVAIIGQANDNVAVTKVTWRNSRGESGTCSGTADWHAEGIKLKRWWNRITITAFDEAGNSNQRTLRIFRWR